MSGKFHAPLEIGYSTEYCKLNKLNLGNYLELSQRLKENGFVYSKTKKELLKK